MGNYIEQFLSETDGCIYFFDEQRTTWRKICDIKDPADLPLDVRKKVREAQDKADHIKAIPLEKQSRACGK